VTTTRRALAIVCIAVVVVTALTVTADRLCAVLVALDPLFFPILASVLPAPDGLIPRIDPALSVPDARAPPNV
jgi:hypothetical protein